VAGNKSQSVEIRRPNAAAGGGLGGAIRNRLKFGQERFGSQAVCSTRHYTCTAFLTCATMPPAKVDLADGPVTAS
jgi:hypothetical protein